MDETRTSNCALNPAGDMKESVEPRVAISGIAPAVMGQLIDYAYTANIVISQQDAQVKTPDTLQPT